MSPEQVRIYIVEDQQIIIDGLCALLSTESSIVMTGFTQKGQEALDKIPEIDPDVLILDIQMPGMDGLEVLEKLMKDRPEQKVLMLTGFDETSLIRKAFALGARGYILKNIPKEGLVEAIHTVASGRRYLDDEVQEKVIGALIDKDQRNIKATNNADSGDVLTAREKDVLVLLAKGLTSKKISEELYVSTHTVDTHRKNILSKLGVSNSAELVQYALRNGLIA
ncbi:MAG: response regulator transcription factor [Saprospiraceae bacterium]|nr:response regulator transcription factor [Saprospiraceae bacterium]